MTFVRAKPAGWALFELLTSSQMNVIDSQMPFALDGQSGGLYAPSAPIQLDGSLAAAATRMLEITGRDGGGALLVQAGTGGTVNRGGYFRGPRDMHPVYADAPANANDPSAPLARIYGAGQANDGGQAGTAFGGVGGAGAATYDGGDGIDLTGGASADRVAGRGGLFTGGDSDAADSNAVGGIGAEVIGGEAYLGGRGLVARGGRSLDAGAPSGRPYGIEAFGGTRALGAGSAGTGVIGRGGDGEPGQNQSGGTGVFGSGGDGDDNGDGGSGLTGFGGPGGTNGRGGFGATFQNGLSGAGATDDQAAISVSANGDGRHISYSDEATLPTAASEMDGDVRVLDHSIHYHCAHFGSVTRKWVPMTPIASFQGYIQEGSSPGAQTLAKTANGEYNIDDFSVNGINDLVTVAFEDTMPPEIGQNYLVHINHVLANAQGAPGGLTGPYFIQVRTKTDALFSFQVYDDGGVPLNFESGSGYFGIDMTILAPATTGT